MTVNITDEGALNLYEAIWTKAMEDELFACKKSIYAMLKGNKIPHARINAIIDKANKYILEAVRKNIIVEEANYPFNKTKEYEYKELKALITEKFLRNVAGE